MCLCVNMYVWVGDVRQKGLGFGDLWSGGGGGGLVVVSGAHLS